MTGFSPLGTVTPDDAAAGGSTSCASAKLHPVGAALDTTAAKAVAKSTALCEIIFSS